MESVYLKTEPDTGGGASPSITEDDIYEDTGDLEFNQDPAYQSLYLTRIPKYLWKVWAELDDDAEIQLGTVRLSSIKMPGGELKQEMGILLRDDLPFHREVPKEYEVMASGVDVKNTYLFSEQDLDGFKSKTKEKFDFATANIPARLTRTQPEKSEKTKFDKEKHRFVPYVKKIPKKTVLAGKIKHEVNCAPVMNPESERILSQRTLAALKPKNVTQRVKNINQNGYLRQGTANAASSFSGFIKTGKVVKGDNRTARIPQNELLDKIFAIFRQWKYCDMRVFRERLRQPEAYIKETLDGIADLAKSGSNNGKWSLKSENLMGTETYATAGVAPTDAAVGGMDGADDSDVDMDGDDRDDDDVKMEDVL